jgi:DNA-binding GntR family transcriptional regulator
VQKPRERTAMLFSPTDPARQALSWQEHAGILRAVIDGDERAAAALAAEHVARAGADYLFGINSGEMDVRVPAQPRRQAARQSSGRKRRHE